MAIVSKLKLPAHESTLFSVLEEIGTLKHFKKNDMIYFQDDDADTFYLLKSGRVRLFFSSQNGNELTVKILGENSLVGDASYFSQTPRVTSASAITDAELISVDLEKLIPYFIKHPGLILELLDFMSQTIRFISIQVFSMAFLSADKKLAHILVQLGTYFKKKDTDSTYSIDFTHQDIAELIGVSRVTIAKELKKFEQWGWLSMKYRNIKILNEQALKKFSLS